MAQSDTSAASDRSSPSDSSEGGKSESDMSSDILGQAGMLPNKFYQDACPTTMPPGALPHLPR